MQMKKTELEETIDPLNPSQHPDEEIIHIDMLVETFVIHLIMLTRIINSLFQMVFINLFQNKGKQWQQPRNI